VHKIVLFSRLGAIFGFSRKISQT